MIQCFFVLSEMRICMTLLDTNESLGPNEIRENLKLWVSDKFNLSDSDILIDELGFYNRDQNSTIDNSYRADLVLANGRLVGFEIKSERDTLKRWESQKVAYTNVFDEVWLCVHSKHLEKAMNQTPCHIGIILTDNFASLAMVRKAKKNHGMNNVYDLTGLLWREELDELINLCNIKIKSRTTKRGVREIIHNEVDLITVRDFALTKLKLRKSQSSSSSCSDTSC